MINNIDLILLDLNLPDSAGKMTFDTIRKLNDNIPVVLITGLLDKELSISLIKEGAQDYIFKQNLNSDLLVKTIHFAIERKKLLNDVNRKKKEIELSMNYFYQREQKMIELKKEINELIIKHGGEKKYF